MYNGDNKITVFDKGNINCRLTVTVNDEIRIKLGHDVPDKDKSIIINEMIRKGKDVCNKNISKTYRKTLYYKKMIDHMENHRGYNKDD